MTLGYTTRYAEEHDMRALKEICRISFDSLYGYYASQSLTSSNHILVSDVEGTVAGFVELKIIHINNDMLGNILWLAIHPKFRRKGIASALIDASIDYFRKNGINIVYVSTRIDNLSALALFQRKGFLKIELRRLLKIYGYKVMEFYLKMHISPREIIFTKTIHQNPNN